MNKISIICLIIILFFTGAAKAAESMVYSVSCSIPEVPGLNAPLIEEETIKPQPNTPEVKIDNDTKGKTEEQISTIVEEDTGKTPSVADKEKSFIIVKTIYSR